MATQTNQTQLLELERKDGIISVKCKECNKILVQFEEDTKKDWLISDCKHFYWELANIRCFYDPDMYKNEYECDPEYIKKLRMKYLLRIVYNNGDYFFLLVPHKQMDRKE